VTGAGAVAILVGLATVGSGRASATPPAQAIQASLSVSISTPTAALGPFVVMGAPALLDPTSDTIGVAGNGLVFGPVETAIQPNRNFTVTLQANTDVSIMLRPASGDAAISGQFTMQWQSNQPNAICDVGPFTVDATTQASGGSPYSPASGAATVVDAQPTIPAASNCGELGNEIDQALSLPVSAPLPQTALASPTTLDPTDPAIVPAISVQLAVSPPLAATPPTTIASSPTTAPPLTVAPDPPPTSPVAHGSGGRSRAPRRPVDTRSSVASTKRRLIAAPKTAQNVPATLGPAGFGPLSGDPAPPPAEPANLPKNNAIALAPTSASGTSGSSGLLFVLVLGTIVLAFALWLIGSDVRRGLSPVRARARFGGTVVRPPRSPRR
jgi:hypothetical protein